MPSGKPFANLSPSRPRDVVDCSNRPKSLKRPKLGAGADKSQRQRQKPGARAEVGLPYSPTGALIAADCTRHRPDSRYG